MALEDLTGPNKFITSLNPANPPINDPAEEGAAHVSGTKNVLVNSFPNINAAVTATPAQLNSTAVPKLPLTGGILSGPLTIINGNTFNLDDVTNVYRTQLYTVDDATFRIDYPGFYNLVSIKLTTKQTDFAGPVTVNGGFAQQGASGVTSYKDGAASVYTQMHSRVEGGPAINWYYGGVRQWGAGVFSDGTWRLFRDDTPASYLLLSDGSTLTLNGITTNAAAGLSRTNSGYRTSATSTDVAMAPGMFRGSGLADANGDVQFNFGFSIPDPKIIATAYKTDTPVICTIIDFSSTHAVVRASQWNGTTFVASAGALIMCHAIHSGIGPY
jgi:hypothetical protein